MEEISAPVAMELIRSDRNYGDEGRSEVIHDAAGNFMSHRVPSRDKTFPVTPGGFQQTFGGGLQDGVVLKFDADVSTLLFSSLGGSANDAAYVMALVRNGHLYVGGERKAMLSRAIMPGR